MWQMRHIVYIIMLSLILPSLACSLGGLGRGEPAPIPSISDSLDGLDSYRARTVLRWTPEDGPPETTKTEIEATRNPFTQRTTMTTEEGTHEWIQVAGMVWHCTDGACSPQSREVTSSFGEEVFLWDNHVAEVFDGLNYRYLGEETVNGIRTLHYVVLSPPPGLFGPLREDASDVQTDVWIANEEALLTFAVRIVTSWKLAVENEQGEGEYSLDVYDVNAPFTIEPPEGAPAAVPEDIPLYPAGTQPLLGGGVSFSAQESPATVVGFYRTELVALGWALESEEEIAQILKEGILSALLNCC